MFSIFNEEEMSLNQRQLKMIEQGKMVWLVQQIAKKLEKYCLKTFDLTHRLEYMQRNLWNKVQKYISEDKVKNPKEYINRINEMIMPHDQAVRLRMGET